MINQEDYLSYLKRKRKDYENQPSEIKLFVHSRSPKRGIVKN